MKKVQVEEVEKSVSILKIQENLTYMNLISNLEAAEMGYVELNLV